MRACAPRRTRLLTAPARVCATQCVNGTFYMRKAPADDPPTELSITQAQDNATCDALSARVHMDDPQCANPGAPGGGDVVVVSQQPEGLLYACSSGV